MGIIEELYLQMVYDTCISKFYNVSYERWRKDIEQIKNKKR